MGHVHSRRRILDAAMAVVREVGLAELTYQRVGRHLGIADRTVVYYFGTKTELTLAVLDVVTEKVRDAMSAMVDERDLTVAQAVSGIWRSLANDDLDPYFRVYVELLGLAVSRRTPYDELQVRIYQEWVAWLEPRMAGPADARRASAVVAFAQVDGLLIVRHLGLTRIADEGAATFLADPRVEAHSTSSR